MEAAFTKYSGLVRKRSAISSRGEKRGAPAPVREVKLAPVWPRSKMMGEVWADQLPVVVNKGAPVVGLTPLRVLPPGPI